MQLNFEMEYLAPGAWPLSVNAPATIEAADYGAAVSQADDVEGALLNDPQ